MINKYLSSLRNNELISKSLAYVQKLSKRELAIVKIFLSLLLAQTFLFMIDMFDEANSELFTKKLEIAEIKNLKNRELTDEQKILISENLAYIKNRSFNNENISIAKIEAAKKIENIAKKAGVANIKLEHLSDETNNNLTQSVFQMDGNYNATIFANFIEDLANADKSIIVTRYSVAGRNFRKFRLYLSVYINTEKEDNQVNDASDNISVNQGENI